MDVETTRIITKITVTLESVQKDIRDMRTDIKDLKKCIPSMEAHNHLERRLEKVEGNISRIVWMIISAVVGAILLLVVGVR